MRQGIKLRNYALRRIAVTAILLIIATAAVLTLITWIYFSRFTSETCTADAQYFAKTVADTFEHINIVKYSSTDSLDNEKDKAIYQAVREYLKGLCDLTGAKYTYLFNVEDERDMRYIMTAASDDAEDDVVQVERGLGVRVRIPDYDLDNILNAAGGSFTGPCPVNNRYGNVLIYYFPLITDGETACVVGIDFDVSAVRRKAFGYTARIVIVITAVLTAVLGVLLIVLSRKVFSPIKKISVKMNSFDPEHEQEKLDIHSYHEIKEINNSFNKLSDDIRGYIGNLRAMTEERAKTAAELNIARSIQIGMVPKQSSISGFGYEVFAGAEPAREVGGDFYDLFEMNGQVFFVIADVSGKGIAAALFMAMVMNMIRGKLRMGLSPAEALNAANDELCAENPEGMFVTVFAAAFDPLTGELVFANAGHTRPLLTGGGKNRFLDPDTGIALGLFEDAGMIDETVMLGSGECVTVYTDGITEAVSADKQLFGEQRLLELAVGVTAEETARSVINAVRSFSEGCVQSDDITVLTLRYDIEGESSTDELPCEMSSLGEMRGRLLGLAEGMPNKRRIALACEEMFVNIVRYSGSEKIGTVIRRSRDRLAVRFEDSGAAFDPLANIPDEKAFDDYDSGGMGIRMVMQIAEKVRYSRKNDKNILTMIFAAEDQ